MPLLHTGDASYCLPKLGSSHPVSCHFYTIFVCGSASPLFLTLDASSYTSYPYALILCWGAFPYLHKFRCCCLVASYSYALVLSYIHFHPSGLILDGFVIMLPTTKPMLFMLPMLPLFFAVLCPVYLILGAFVLWLPISVPLFCTGGTFTLFN